MRISVICVIVLLLGSCDDSRVFEKNFDFAERYWSVKENPTFEFFVRGNQPYNLYCNLRNGMDYPYARIFFNYTLKDSAGNEISKKMVGSFLFDEKTGAPLGSSGLGDIYDHQILLLKDFRFKTDGTYIIQFEQFMRTDSLDGMLAVGLRVENSIVSE